MDAATITAIGAIGAAAVTGVFLVLSVRKKGSAEVQEAINSGFTNLVDKLTAEINRQTHRIADLEEHITQLEARCDNCQVTIEHYEEFIRSRGLVPPPMDDET